MTECLISSPMSISQHYTVCLKLGVCTIYNCLAWLKHVSWKGAVDIKKRVYTSK